MSEVINYFVGGLFITFVSIVFGTITTNKKLNQISLKEWMFCLLILILYTLCFSIIEGPILTAITTIGYIIIYKYVFKFTKRKSIFLGISYCLALLLSEIILFIIITIVLELPNDYIYNIFANSIISNIMISILTGLIIILVRKIIKSINSYNFEADKLLISVSVITIICIGICFYGNYYNIEFNGKFITITIVIVSFIAILFILLRQRIINNNVTAQYDALIEFVKDYEDIIEQQRINQHENRNQLISIKSQLTDKSDQKNIIDYIDLLLNEKTNFSKEKYSSFKYLPPNGLKGLFYYKVYNAESKGIGISLNISPSIINSELYNLNKIEYKQLFRIIGVYLDNAIEGSAETTNKVIGLEVFKDEDGVNIIISNSYLFRQNKDKFKSTKGPNRGHGLMVVEKIIDNHKIFNKETIKTNDLYIQKLSIKKDYS